VRVQAFVRMVGLLRLEGSPWAFLKPVQASQSPVPRAVLAHKCGSDKAALGLTLATIEEVRALPEQVSP
jgi:hypothetical protein